MAVDLHPEVTASSAVNGLVAADALGEIRTRFDELHAALLAQGHLPGATLALCQLRLLQLHRIEAGAESSALEKTGDRYRCLSNWHREKIFSPAEKACLQFTEVYAMDTQALTDEMADDVKRHYGDAGLVVLTEALGVFDGAARLHLLWGSLVVAEVNA